MTPQPTPPSPWIERWAHLIAPGGSVLDVAAGSGRHATWLAARGHVVTAVDRDGAAVMPLTGIAEVIVAEIFGVRYLSMLGGFVFLSHQVGSFLGVWLGGRLYDATGSYDVVWWIAVALGVFAALVNLPIRERAILRPAAA